MRAEPSLEGSMAQVWLSFDEIQQMFSCDSADARRRVVANQWERRRCGDGLVRTLVPSEVAHDFFMLRYRHQPESRRAPANEFEAAMEALCRIFGAEASSGPIRPVITTTEASTRGRESARVRTAA
jgi:hypothetical protein